MLQRASVDTSVGLLMNSQECGVFTEIKALVPIDVFVLKVRPWEHTPQCFPAPQTNVREAFVLNLIVGSKLEQLCFQVIVQIPKIIHFNHAPLLRLETRTGASRRLEDLHNRTRRNVIFILIWYFFFKKSSFFLVSFIVLASVCLLGSRYL